MMVDINPKAVTTDELFGYINPATREWKDGTYTWDFPPPLCACGLKIYPPSLGVEAVPLPLALNQSGFRNILYL